MRILLRLAHGTGDPIPLCTEVADDATIGELADHLATLLGLDPGRTIDGLHHNSLVRDVGPRSGSVVHLVDRSYDDLEELSAPVRALFTIVDGERSDDAVTLEYGTNDLLGAVGLHVSDRVELLPLPNSRILINGHPTIGSRHVVHGDVISVLDISGSGVAASWDRHSTTTAFVVEVTGRLDPPTSGPFRSHRPQRRIHDEFIAGTIRAAAAPDASRLPGLPVLSVMVPLIFGAALWVATRSAATAMFILFSFVYVAAAAIESRVEFHRERRFRESEFRSASGRTIELLEHAQTDEVSFLDRTTPDPATVIDILTADNRRLWERGPEDTTGGFLSVRIGMALRLAATRVEDPPTGRTDLVEWFEEQLSAVSHTDMPVSVDLENGAGLGLIGHDNSTMDLARWILVQLATLIGPDLLRMIIVPGPTRSHEWEWAAWLPHIEHGSGAQRILVVVDGADDQDVVQSLDGIDRGTVRFLWLVGRRADLPGFIGQWVDLTGRPGLVRARDDDRSVFETVGLEDLSCDSLPYASALELAAALTPLVPERILGPGRHVDHRSITLTDIVSAVDPVEPATILASWARNRRGSALSAPLARSGTSTIEIDLVSDGPHALVAGMTGAGKSELLRTWLLSLALHHPPDRVTFLLVDYKGGSAFGPLSGLPHTVGLITDLDAQLAERAMVSLRAELRSRETWLAAVSSGSMSDAQGHTDRPPALLVVVDEFATLAKELPGLVDELVDVAQRGRSLGIHLILATQRPHGVVNESIRANTAIRIALRVADTSDSSDVIDTPDAASIPRDSPGSAIVRIGQARSGMVRFAYSSAPSATRARVRSWRLTLDGAPIDDERTSSGNEIDMVVSAIANAFSESAATLPRRPWMAPLESGVTLASLDPVRSDHWLTIGLKDRPELQEIIPLRLDLDEGPGIAVFGSAGEGRSMALATIVESAARTFTNRTVYSIGRVIDHASDSIPLEDSERVLRVLRGALSHVQEPLDRHRMLIVIDDIATFENRYETLNRGEAMDIIEKICRDGGAGRTNIVLGASRRMDLPSRLAVGFAHQIVLHVTSEDEASLLAAPTALAGDIPQGRGFHDGHWIQIAAGSNSSDLRVTEHQAVPALPARIPLHSIGSGPHHEVGITQRDRSQRCNPVDDPSAVAVGHNWRIPIGLGADDLAPVFLDLTHGHAIVAGPRRSGCSNTLGVAADSWRRYCQPAPPEATVLIEPGPGTPDTWVGSTWSHRISVSTVPWGHQDQSWVLAAFDDVINVAQQSRPALIAFDQLPTMLESSFGDHLEQFLQSIVALSERGAVRIMASGEIDAISRCYSPALTTVRASRTGILLQPDIDIHGSILGCELDRRDELDDRPGRGWLVTNGESVPLQVATRD